MSTLEANFPTRPCIHCGYCCRVASCVFGKYDTQARRCKHLTTDNLCGIFDEITALPSHGIFSPAFGSGCCSSLNPVRQQKLKKGNKNMSELTECNYCTLRRIKANAKKNGDVVTVRPGKFMSGFRGVDIFVHKPDIKNPQQPAAWFVELPDHCRC
jgi:hypothetical protein